MFLEKQSKNAGKDQYAYRCLILDLLKWNFVKANSELWVFILKHDQKNINKLNQFLKRETALCYTTTSLLNWSDKDNFACDNKMIHCRYILLEHPKTSDIVRHYCRKHGGRVLFFLLRQIDNWLSVIILADLLERRKRRCSD